MILADFQGRLVDVPGFIARAGPRFRERKLYARCPECDAQVYPQHAEGPRDPSFNHWPNAAEGCWLATHSNANLGVLGNGAVDHSRGALLRDEFLADYAPRSYALLRNVTLQPAPTVAEFIRLVRRADGRGLWSFAGMEVWMMPFILPLLDEFAGVRFPYHFVMRRGPTRTLLMNGGRDLLLDRVFSRGGESTKAKPEVPNPLPVSPGSLAEYGRASWILPGSPLITAAARLRRAA